MNEETMNPTAREESTEDAFLTGWEDTEPAEEPADQPAAQQEPTEEQEQAGQEESAAQQTEPDRQEAQQQEAQADQTRTWTLRHLEENRTVSEPELITLAQQGMDYDRIREKYDESKPVMELFRQFASQANMTIPEYVRLIRTRAKEAEGASEEDARRSVEMEDREAAVSAREEALAQQDAQQQRAQEAQEAREARRQQEIEQFRTTYPEAASHPETIPQEVFEKAQSVGLTAAYAMHQARQAQEEAAQARQQLEALELSGKNRDRATGSMKSAGEDSAGKDPFLEGWNS